MDIMYKKETLYVYLKGIISKEKIDVMEHKVNDIMDRYKICNLVIESEDKHRTKFYEFEKRHNSKYRSKVIIK